MRRLELKWQPSWVCQAKQCLHVDITRVPHQHQANLAANGMLCSCAYIHSSALSVCQTSHDRRLSCSSRYSSSLRKMSPWSSCHRLSQYMARTMWGWMKAFKDSCSASQASKAKSLAHLSPVVLLDPLDRLVGLAAALQACSVSARCMHLGQHPLCIGCFIPSS